ncbi:host-nuclease inhibitor Gam family protein [Oleidesulfovibrio sp.]|uniref:host-nuclease inhibitor Gam family protein n=1 Tax=Oleidesulfovibrio sp. TaxID=2909707 RepID=UPI003A8ACCE5
MSRTKPKTHIIGSLQGMEAALAEMADIDRSIARHTADMNEVMDKAKADSKAQCEPLLQRRKALEDAVATFATLHRSELFDKKKSRDLGFGIVGFRKVTKLLTLPKITLGNVLERLHDLGFTSAIRTKESVDREVMREWPEERLHTVGMRRVSEDEFYIEIASEELAREA